MCVGVNILLLSQSFCLAFDFKPAPRDGFFMFISLQPLPLNVRSIPMWLHPLHLSYVYVYNADICFTLAFINLYMYCMCERKKRVCDVHGGMYYVLYTYSLILCMLEIALGLV